jgi:hypothetical protein
MTTKKFKQLWDNIVVPAIEDYLEENKNYKLNYGFAGLDEFRKTVESNYNKLKPYFKDTYMKKYDMKKQDDIETEDKDIRADRHKVAALIYLALVCNNQSPFVRLNPSGIKNGIFDFVACHEIAYDVSLNCIESFIYEIRKQNPKSLDTYKDKFLNGGFKSPPLICEKYADYRDSIIPRMVWAVKEASKQFEGETAPSLRETRIATNANMLANIFYFLELYSSL